MKFFYLLSANLASANDAAEAATDAAEPRSWGNSMDCTTANQMQYWNNIDFGGSDIQFLAGVGSLELCAQHCLNNHACTAFLFDTWNRFWHVNCWLKTGYHWSDAHATYYAGLIAGHRCNFRNRVVPPDGYYPALATTTTTTTTTTTPKPTTTAAPTPTQPSQDCSNSKFCYWKDTGCGFSQNFLHQCAVSTQEKCWDACKKYKGCQAASFDTQGRWATNCFLYADLSPGQTTPFPGLITGWMCSLNPPNPPALPPMGCSDLPPPFPTTGPPTVEPTVPPTPKPPAPTCSGAGHMFCRVYSDPHFQSISGHKWDQHEAGKFVMAEYSGNDLPKFKVVLEFAHRWPCNPRITMVEKWWITWESKDGCGSWEMYGYQGSPRTCGPPHGPQGRMINNWIGTTITYIDNKTGQRSGTTSTAQKNWNGNALLRHRQTMTFHTWFGLAFYYDAIDWDAHLHIPNCYRFVLGPNSLCLITWGHHTWQHRARRALLEGESDQTAVTDATHTYNKRSADTCPARSTIEDRCGIMSQPDGPFQQCHAKFPTDGEFGFEANCVTDHCEDTLGDTVVDACSTLKSYAKMCMANMAGDLQKSDRICKWASETGCEPECPANSHFSPCADLCRDINTCGDRSPVPRNCGPAEFESMCICNDGYFLIDGDCLPESECGCVTDEQNVVKEGFSEDTCHEHCVCKDGKYTCELHPEGTVIDGCTAPEVTDINVLDELADLKAAFMDVAQTKLDKKFKNIITPAFDGVTKRMNSRYHDKYGCPLLAPKLTLRVSESPCAVLINTTKDVIDWIIERYAACDTSPKPAKQSKSFRRKLNNNLTKLEKRCGNKLLA